MAETLQSEDMLPIIKLKALLKEGVKCLYKRLDVLIGKSFSVGLMTCFQMISFSNDLFTILVRI